MSEAISGAGGGGVDPDVASLIRATTLPTEKEQRPFMIDHISVGVSDLERSARFYEDALAPLGLSRLVTRPATIGFGKSYPEFWINLRAGMAPVPPESG